MKEEWLFPNAFVPVDVETTSALVAEIKRLIDVVGGMALAQASQEPVLWEMPDGKIADRWALQFYGGQKGKPLYTTPPQRTWVGLTDEDFQPMVQKAMVYYGYKPEYSKLTSGAGFYVLVRAIEAKLKEKNT